MNQSEVLMLKSPLGLVINFSLWLGIVNENSSPKKHFLSKET